MAFLYKNALNLAHVGGLCKCSDTPSRHRARRAQPHTELVLDVTGTI